MSYALFDPGRVVATPSALRAFDVDFRTDCLMRHLKGDWGDLCEEDKEANQQALRDGSRILSAYIHPTTKEKLYVITEADRSSTCLLLPDDY